MKVSGIGPTGSTGTARRSAGGGTKSTDFARALAEAGATEETHALVAAPLAGVDALLAAQAMTDCSDREARQRMVSRGEDILDRLEEIRHGLLIGAVPKQALLDLARLVRSRREGLGDPQLLALLDEIELRAQVELAKLSRHP